MTHWIDIRKYTGTSKNSGAAARFAVLAVCVAMVDFAAMPDLNVIADIAAALRDQKISVESLLQHGRADGEGQSVPVVITTHETGEAAMRRALAQIAESEAVLEAPRIIRIEML